MFVFFSVFLLVESVQATRTMSDGSAGTSIHSDHVEDVYDVPMKAIIRPLPSEVNEQKVSSLMETLQVS